MIQEKIVGFELNVTHQLLACADDSVLGKNINIIKNLLYFAHTFEVNECYLFLRYKGLKFCLNLREKYILVCLRMKCWGEYLNLMWLEAGEICTMMSFINLLLSK